MIDEPLGDTDVYEALPVYARTYKIRLSRPPAVNETVVIQVNSEETMTGVNNGLASGTKMARQVLLRSGCESPWQSYLEMPDWPSLRMR